MPQSFSKQFVSKNPEDYSGVKTSDITFGSWQSELPQAGIIIEQDAGCLHGLAVRAIGVDGSICSINLEDSAIFMGDPKAVGPMAKEFSGNKGFDILLANAVLRASQTLDSYQNGEDDEPLDPNFLYKQAVFLQSASKLSGELRDAMPETCAVLSGKYSECGPCTKAFTSHPRLVFVDALLRSLWPKDKLEIDNEGNCCVLKSNNAAYDYKFKADQGEFYETLDAFTEFTSSGAYAPPHNSCVEQIFVEAQRETCGVGI